MQLNFIHFLAIVELVLLVQSNSILGLRADDNEAAEALGRILDNSIDFSAKAEAIVMPRIEEWLVQRPFQSTFSTITISSVFTKLAEYVVESEGVHNPNASFVYSSNKNKTTVEFEQGPVKEIKLTLLFRASEHRFLASEFHKRCDRQGATITLVNAENGRMAAAYSGVDWGLQPWGCTANPRGFLASIAEDPGAIEGYSLYKYAANEEGSVLSHPNRGPWFGAGLVITNRCHENEYSSSHIGMGGYGDKGVDPFFLFGSYLFRVLEYEVFQVEIQTIV
jgi:hypothetical protein